MPKARTSGQRRAKKELIAATLGGALDAAAKGDSDANDGLKKFVCEIAEGLAEGDFESLRESAQSAGFELSSSDGAVRLLPLDEPAVPLSAMITALEADFDHLGFTTAKGHYRQAIESLLDGRPEAANGQLRSTFEEVVVKLAESRGFARQQQGAGGSAISYLISNGDLPAGDGGEYIRGLWKIVHTNGPHPGTSPAGEARYRAQAITAAIRYLIDRLT